MNRKAAQSIIGITITVAFLSLIVSVVGLDELMAPWKDFSLLAGVIAISLIFLSYIARAFRVYDYFRTDMSGQFAGMLKLNLYHIVANNFLPMRSGEISFPVLMSRYFQIPVARSVPALLWFRLLDLHALVCIGISAVIWYSTGPILGAGFVLVSLPLPFLGIWLRRWSLGTLHTLGDGRLVNITQAMFAALPESLGQARNTMLWTWSNWGAKLLSLAWVLLQFTEVDLPTALYSIFLADLTSVLPIHSVAGFGTYEGGVVAGLVPTGVPVVEALQIAVNVHLFVLGSSILGGAAAMFLPRRTTLSEPVVQE